jgi:signal transduction histidine kinase
VGKREPAGNRKLLLTFVLPLIGSLFVIGVAVVQVVNSMVRHRRIEAAGQVVRQQAERVESFFTEKGRTISTMIAEPRLVRWLATFDRKNEFISGESDQDFHDILVFFQNIRKTDNDILTPFIASALTGRYFRDGSFERQELTYDARTRPLWSTIVERDRLFVANPLVDSMTGDVSVAINTTVYQGETMIGIAGVDVLLSTIGELVRGMSYRGEGAGFLLDRHGNQVFIDDELKEMRNFIVEVGSSSFLAESPVAGARNEKRSELKQTRSDELGSIDVIWQGERQVVLHEAVRTEVPEVDWVLGLVIPARVVSAPWKATVIAYLGYLVLTGLIILVAVKIRSWKLIRQQQRLEQLIDARTCELQQQTKRLKAAQKELELFAYSVSHDLRAPIRKLNGLISMLLTTGDDQTESRQVLVERIGVNCNKMYELIDALLELSRTSRAPLEAEEIDLSKLVGEIAETLLIGEEDRSLTLRIAPNLKVIADQTLMRVVVQNLLENSLKFTQSKEQAVIEIGSNGPSPAHSGQTVLFVRDNGVGFDMKLSERLFIPFQRLHHGHEYPGSGIGLPTVHKIIQRHGGSIWAESEPDKGATFYFTLEARPETPFVARLARKS